MTLRTRIVALIGLVLLASVLLGAAVAGWEARRTLHAELDTALIGGRQTVSSTFEDLPRSDHADRDLRQLLADFDGDRHVRAVLVDAAGRRLAASAAPARLGTAPAWFAELLGPTPRALVVAIPGAAGRGGAIRLEPTPAPDVEALWRELSGVLAVLIVGALAALALVHLLIGAAIRPLRSLSEAFGRIGDGDYAGRVREQGPPEIVRLERAFNSMADQLAAMQGRNQALETQLSTIQDEERADLARDLHDEIGPHLFSVNIDAQIIGGLLGSERETEIPERLRAIQGAVAHMQRQVRDILGRLRPTRAVELGLNAAIDDLVLFWRMRRPEVEIELQLSAEEQLPEAVKDVVYRVVQEGLANAMRHGEATRVRVGVAGTAAGQLTAQVADNGVRRTTSSEGGFGLVGMRERVRAAGGVLTIDTGAAGGRGWVVTARLPLGRPAAETAA